MQQLRKRSGFGPIFNIASPFEFQSDEPVVGLARWRNLDQLEAVVEFFINYRPDAPANPADPWGDPWANNAKPRSSGDPNYVNVDLGVSQGPEAKGVPGAANTISLDGTPDLSTVVVNPDPAINTVTGPPLAPNYPRRRRYLYDTLWLKEDSARPSKLFRIMAVDDAAKTVTLDVAPNLTGKTSAWRLNRRPIIVIIDPLDARTITDVNNPQITTVWRGANATTVGPDPLNAARTILQLDVALPFDRINTGQDTVYLPNDSGSHKPGRTYRISAVNGAARQISVDGTPNIGAGSAWHVPAGISGTLSRGLQYDLNPPAAAAHPQRALRGHDHYDADLFIVHRGAVQSRFRFSSFTSRDYGSWHGGANWRQYLSSLRGNARYYFASTWSTGDGAQYRNFALAVVDAMPSPPDPPPNGLHHNQADHVTLARFYFGTPSPPAPAGGGVGGDVLSTRVMEDSGAAPPLGKDAIRFHRGNMQPYNSGSAGCLVSPIYFRMRNELVRFYEKDYREFYGGGRGTVDTDVHVFIDPAAKPNGRSVAGSEALWAAETVAMNSEASYSRSPDFLPVFLSAGVRARHLAYFSRPTGTDAIARLTVRISVECLRTIPGQALIAAPRNRPWPH